MTPVGTKLPEAQSFSPSLPPPPPPPPPPSPSRCGGLQQSADVWGTGQVVSRFWLKGKHLLRPPQRLRRAGQPLPLSPSFNFQ